MPLHSLSVDAALQQLGSARDGLSDAEAAARLARHGPNALRAPRRGSAWAILLDQLTKVVVVPLFAAAAVSLIVRDFVEAAAIGAVLVINTLVGFVSDLRARRAMEALLRLETPGASVVRGGRARAIDARDLVPGDIVRLEAGQSVPADARIIEATDVQADEAPLTGESLPVAKHAESLAEDTVLPDRANMLYKGTIVVTGTARAVVGATGMATELGRIGGLVGALPDERTPLEKRLDALGRRLVWLAVGIGAIVAAIGALRGLPLARMIETGIALAIAAVPEGLPAVATIALAVGMHRMARRHALVRRLPSVETLGSVTVICADKTGTLTAGEMTVTTLALPDREITISGTGYEPRGLLTEGGRSMQPPHDPQLRTALHVAMLANRAEVELGDEGWVVHGDPTEGALLVAARKAGLARAELLAAHPEAGDVPFSSERMLMATFHQVPGKGLVAHVKGAPARVLERCSRVHTVGGDRPMDEAWRGTIMARNDALAARGLRVLALASGPVTAPDEASLGDLAFVGLAGMIDPPAPGVLETIRQFRQAGIRTVMITGDQRRTAEAIAEELGILSPGDEVLDGRALASLSDAELTERVARVAAFCRVSPEDKLSIVRAYQRRGAIVAMLGDGVNDAAALKKADVGVTMGVRGTDVAREVAAVVLQDDRFATIGSAVEEGRVIFDNIRKFVFYLFSCNLAEVLVLLTAALAGFPLPLLPLQILWLNLVTDTFPALALALEPAEEDVMHRPPRDPEEAILSPRFLRSISAYAVLITAATLSAFALAILEDGVAGPRAVTMSFATLGLAQGLHLGNARRRTAVLTPAAVIANRWALGAVLLVAILQVVAVQFRPLGTVLHTQPLALRDWLVVGALALVPAVVGQVAKRIREGRPDPRREPAI